MWSWRGGCRDKGRVRVCGQEGRIAMLPSSEQVRIGAYFRWAQRGFGHGAHLDDWVAAEQVLLFSMNYEVVASYRLNDPEPTRIGRSRPRVCRFCEQGEPRTTFSDDVPVLAGSSLRVMDQCEECQGQFSESLDGPLDAFLTNLSRGMVPESVPIAAYKALVKTALEIVPEDELDLFPDAVEWVCNPDHDHDGGSFSRMGMGIFLHQSGGLRESFVALARKIEDGEAMPSALFFVGGAGFSLSMAVPLCARDEELEGEELIVPRLATVGEGDSGLPLEPVESRFLAVQAAAPARRRLMPAWAG